MGSTPVLVTNQDVQALQKHLRPGSVIPSRLLYPRYVTVMDAAGSAPASRVALGRALSRAGWERRLLRRSHGRRGHQTHTGNWCWVVPGGPPVTWEDEQMGAVVAAILDGRDALFVPDHQFRNRYADMARQWRGEGLMSQAQITQWFKDKGSILTPHGGKRGRNGWRGVPSRYIHVGMVPPPHPGPEVSSGR